MPECICDLNIDWSGMDLAWYPYFAIGGNYLCEDLPDCIANSEHLNISLDQFIYSFMVEAPQNCDENTTDISLLIPLTFAMNPVYPNPFNPITAITYTLPTDSYVMLTVYDIRGTKISQLEESFQTSGTKTIIWDAQNQPTGIYLFELRTEGKSLFTKGLLLK